MAGENGERTNQKARTQRAILEACVSLIRQNRSVTMPVVAKVAMVSEATAYRYFPDLASLLSKALAEDWPTPSEALAPVEGSRDPVERVAFATRFLLEGVAARQTVVRSMIATSITDPDHLGKARPGIRFGLIEEALSPFADALESANLDAQLNRDLAVVMSAEALFCLTDFCGLSIAEAVASVVTTARTITDAAFRTLAGSKGVATREPIVPVATENRC
jgi:AcrR family transcriptional regulator